jgi:hypothetical protein
MPLPTKLDRPVHDGSPTTDLTARVSAASRAFLDASGDQREAVALHSAALLGEVLDGCRTRAALDDLDRRASAGFPVWIPDAALELGRLGRVDEGMALLTRLCATLGYAPFSPELLAGMMNGMRRWCSREGEREIDLTPRELSRLVLRLISESGSPKRLEQLGAVLGRSVEDWHERAADMLCDAGPVGFGDGETHLVLPFPVFGPDSGWERPPSVPRVGRNAPCPCGSGRKHKRCCGRAGEVTSSAHLPARLQQAVRGGRREGSSCSTVARTCTGPRRAVIP